MLESVNFENVWLSISEFWAPLIGIAVIIICLFLVVRFIKNKKKNKRY